MREGNPGTTRLVLGMLALMCAGATQGIEFDPPIVVADGNPNWRWIGERTNTAIPCPRPPALFNWTVQPLFCPLSDPDDPESCNAAETIPPGLRAFCSYEWTPPEPDETPVTPSEINKVKRLVTLGQLKSLAPDSMAVAGFGSELQDQTWQALATHLKRQAGLPTVAPPVPLEPAPLVRLAVVDTQPTSDSDPDEIEANSPHGNALVNMADELLCNDAGNCAATLSARLALGYTCVLDRDINDPACRDPVLGGWIGTIGHLARAVRLEVREWIDPLVPGHRLVLNLSVAWHPRFGGLQANVAAMPVPVRAVYAAIADAQCRGALVFAAAGNVTGGPEDQSGPMLPAAWEQRRALTMMECQNRLGAAPPNIFPPAGSDQRPFVYAVAGVRGDGAPLLNARPESEPPFVAYGDHANVANEFLPGPPFTPTATLTGSSVATLVASATAASAWFVADHLVTPPLKPFAIMDLLYASGNKLGRDAAICRGGTSTTPCPGVPPEVTEVQICAAHDALTGGATCPSFSPLALAIDDSGFQQVALSTLVQRFGDPGCGDVTVWHNETPPPANPCPFAQYYSELAEPWTAPQPNDTPCPNCGTGSRLLASAATTIYLEIDDSRSWKVTDATLQCGDSLNRLPVGLLTPGDQVAVLLDDEEKCPAGSEMSIYFIDQFGQTTIDTVLDGG